MVNCFVFVILCSVHSVWFVNCVFSAKICFVKTSTRIVKYELWVVKSNTECKNLELSFNVKKTWTSVKTHTLSAKAVKQSKNVKRQ